MTVERSGYSWPRLKRDVSGAGRSDSGSRGGAAERLLSLIEFSP